ncbi:ABC transporter permease [Burkholderiaceae bacterium DAT-1]|nr:ABC transporter permease [Burkholderiaceae bacterium DAT-1]
MAIPRVSMVIEASVHGDGASCYHCFLLARNKHVSSSSVGLSWKLDLLLNLARRDVDARYRGSFLGFFWSFINPLAMLGAYAFVFGMVFKVRWTGAGSGNSPEFVAMIFSGLLIFNLFAEVLHRSVQVMAENVNYVKKVVFPLDILPVSLVLSGVIHAFIAFALLLVVVAITLGLHWSALLAVFYWIGYLFFLIGTAYCVAAIAVYVPDTKHVVTFLCAFMQFMSPVFYPVSAVPESFRWLMQLSPITFPIEGIRSCLIHGEAVNTMPLVAYVLLTILFAYLGRAFFMRLKGGFADAI